MIRKKYLPIIIIIFFLIAGLSAVFLLKKDFKEIFLKTSKEPGLVFYAEDLKIQGDYLEIPASRDFDLTEKVTIKVSVKYSADPRTFNGMILAKYDEDFDLPYYISSGPVSGGIKFVIRDEFGREHSAIFPQSKLSDWQNTWYEIIGIFDGKKLRILVNGEEGVPAEFEGKIKISKEGLRIGGRGTNDFVFRGIVQEVKIYNEVK